MAKSHIINVPDHVENETAYIAAAQARIANNARIGRAKRWNAAYPEASKRINDFLFPNFDNDGEFDHHYDRETGHTTHNPVIMVAEKNNFYHSLIEAILNYGALTDNQTAAALKLIDRCFTTIQNREAEKAKIAANSNFVGNVKDRMEFANLTVKFRTEYESQFGTVLVYSFIDDNGNVIVYKGSKVLENANGVEFDRGDVVSLKATVKAHNVREGVNQTLISRPVVL